MKFSELKLRRELYWVYTNILHDFGKWDIEQIKKRLQELRYFKEEKQDDKHN